MGEQEKRERFNRLDSTSSMGKTMGAIFDLGVMSKTMLTPSMRTAAQSIVRYQMKKGTFPFIDCKPLSLKLYKDIFDNPPSAPNLPF